MSTVQITCPHCDFSKSVDRQRISAGRKKVTCPHCQRLFLYTMEEVEEDFDFQPAVSLVKPVNKVALLLLTFFLGGVGGHKFYLRKYLQGLLYLLFCWSGIPALIALFEFIIYACKSEADLQQAYS